jgi:hypothetical protein
LAPLGEYDVGISLLLVMTTIDRFVPNLVNISWQIVHGILILLGAQLQLAAFHTFISSA